MHIMKEYNKAKNIHTRKDISELRSSEFPKSFNIYLMGR